MRLQIFQMLDLIVLHGVVWEKKLFSRKQRHSEAWEM